MIDLEEVGFGAVTAGRTYSAWMPLLSPQQGQFIEEAPEHSLKLRGAAGTGKTLAMELKALREVYRAADSDGDIRVLYVTHSWAVAEQVQESIEQLDERGVLGEIDVIPLLTLAEQDLQRQSRVRILGEDSLEGKEAQLREIAALLDDLRRGDWLAYKSSVSQEFRRRIEAASGTAERNRFLWDLMLEFACVIGANGIMPGLKALERYKEIERRPWMMPLGNDVDKEVVFRVYTKLVRNLVDRDEMTTDQVINDYLAYLSTYRWHAERRDRGYDIIFVDEFHLFNEQERMVFHSLTRDADKVPLIMLAMDPKQSPTEIYVEFAAPGGRSEGSGTSEMALGPTSNIDLTKVYRYTSEILDFLQHLDRHYPALDLGADWEIGVTQATSDGEYGDVPRLTLERSPAEEVEAAFAAAEALGAEGGTVAVLCLDGGVLRQYHGCVKDRPGRYVLMQSRDDVEELRYTKRTIVLSQPHYVAGLQFDSVVIAGCRGEFSQYDPQLAYSLRRFLSDIYLAASRARRKLMIYGSLGDGNLPEVIDSAVDAGVLELVENQ